MPNTAGEHALEDGLGDTWQCDEEQRARWVPLAADMRIIGTYAQTELGHCDVRPVFEEV